MSKDPAFLRQRFAKYITRNWTQNGHDLKNISCVYAILGIDPYEEKVWDVYYIGSTTQLQNRYRSHKAPYKVQDLGLVNILFYQPMELGFYDYEHKLIGSLKPRFNKQFTNG